MILSSLWLEHQSLALSKVSLLQDENMVSFIKRRHQSSEAATRPTSEWDWPGLGDVRVGGHSRAQHLLSCALKLPWEAEGCWLEAGHLECCVTSHFCNLRTSVFWNIIPWFSGCICSLVPPSALSLCLTLN